MSNSSGQKDPSMDEILGSIRRIITEDNAQTGEPADPADAVPEADQENILELTDEVGAAGDAAPRREPMLAQVEPAAGDSVTDESTERREPVLGIHAPDLPPESQSAAPVLETPAAEPAAAAEPASMFGAAPQQEESAMAMSDEPPEPTAEQPATGPSDIVSESTTSATTAALGELNKAMDEKVSRFRVGEGDATVSDLVKGLIRPMLREWIDENLPPIVERVVRREIQKLVDRTQDDD